MTRAVKAVTTYRGRDPRDFTLCAFGGNGPLIGVEIARALAMRRVLVPPAPGVFSALGLLFSDTEHEVVRTLMLRGDEITARRLEAAFAELEAEATADLAGTAGATVTVSRYADIRYAGQAYELSVAVPPGAIDVERARRRLRRRARAHLRPRLGRRPGRRRLDPRARPPRAHRGAAATTRVAAIRALPAYEGTRRAYFGPDVGLVETPVCNRAGLLAGERRGPLLVDEYDSTCVVPPGCLARLDGYGNIEVELVV